MKNLIKNFWVRCRDWTLKWAHSPHMAAALFFISLAEAIFFPIPPDILLIAILMIRSERWKYYAWITTAGSVVGAIGAYVIGYTFYETIGIQLVEIYNLQKVVEFLGTQFSLHAFLAVFVAAFTPVPFKAINLAAGLFRAPAVLVISAAIVGRGLRYFIIAYMIKVWGKWLNEFVYKYFNILSIIFVTIVIFFLVLIKVIF